MRDKARKRKNRSIRFPTVIRPNHVSHHVRSHNLDALSPENTCKRKVTARHRLLSSGQRARTPTAVHAVIAFCCKMYGLQGAVGFHGRLDVLSTSKIPRQLTDTRPLVLRLTWNDGVPFDMHLSMLAVFIVPCANLFRN